MLLISCITCECGQVCLRNNSEIRAAVTEPVEDEEGSYRNFFGDPSGGQDQLWRKHPKILGCFLHSLSGP